MQTKPLKLHEDTYNALDRVRVKGESFDNTVRRLLRTYQGLESLAYWVGIIPWVPPLPAGAQQPQTNQEEVKI